MYVFGMETGLLEFISLAGLAALIFVMLLEYVFSRTKALVRAFDDQELTMNRIMRELKDDLNDLQSVTGQSTGKKKPAKEKPNEEEPGSRQSPGKDDTKEETAKNEQGAGNKSGEGPKKPENRGDERETPSAVNRKGNNG